LSIQGKISKVLTFKVLPNFHILQGLRGKQMDTHMEEASQQHLTLMCSMVTKQQQQIVSMKKVINNLAVNQSGT